MLPPTDKLEALLRAQQAPEPPDPPARRAGVAMVLRLDEPAPAVLLMTRVEHEADPWSGHVSFPGGMRAPGDADLLATALRETREETGLDLSSGARLLCRLAPMQAVARARTLAMDITPFVFRLDDAAGLAPGDEAQELFWLPLAPLVSGDLDGTFPYVHDGVTRELPCWRYEGRLIWGLTYRMLRGLLQRVTALLLVLALGSAHAQNVLANASFEDDPDAPVGWSMEVAARNGDQGGISRMAIDSQQAHGGERALRLSGDGDTVTWNAATQADLPAEPGRRYWVAAWMRTEDVRKQGNQYVNCNVFVQFKDARGQFIRMANGYPVAGTQALTGTQGWTRVQRVVRSPAGTASASFGCFLSCSGTAWFDEVLFEPIQQPRWKEKRSERFVVRWEGKQRPPRQALAGNDENLARLEKLLGVSHPDPIPYYKYASNERKGQLTGNPGNAHVENGSEIHSIFWADRHEVVHVLTRHWGDATALLGEGVAVHLSGAWQGEPVHAWTRRLADEGKLLPLKALCSTTDFRSHPDLVTYGQAGSWVRWLLDEHGLDRFRRLYQRMPIDPSPTDFARHFRAVYMQDLAQAERAWHTALGLKAGS